MHGFELQRFAMQLGALDFSVALKFPGGNDREILVVPLRLALGSLMLFTKVSAA
jgi:hypothetical protein